MSEPRPILDQVNLVSGDVLASVEFYRALGVDIPDTHPGWNEHHRTAEFGDNSVVDLDLDSTAFAASWGSTEISRGPLVSFRVQGRDDVDALYAKLTDEGHRGLREPYDAFWGSRYAILEDPGGVAVGLMSEPSEEHRLPPPDVSTFSDPSLTS